MIPGLSFLTSLPGKIAIAGLAISFAYGAGYVHGSSNAKSKAQVAALSNAVKILRNRNEVDDEINDTDRAALCASMGLSDTDADECVRRLAEADAEGSNSSPHNQE